MTNFTPLTWVVDRFENGSAVLLCNGQELIVPKSQLPERIKEGDTLLAEFYHLKDEKRRKDNLAKALLEEILGS